MCNVRASRRDLGAWGLMHLVSVLLRVPVPTPIPLNEGIFLKTQDGSFVWFMELP